MGRREMTEILSHKNRDDFLDLVIEKLRPRVGGFNDLPPNMRLIKSAEDIDYARYVILTGAFRGKDYRQVFNQQFSLSLHLFLTDIAPFEGFAVNVKNHPTYLG